MCTRSYSCLALMIIAVVGCMELVFADSYAIRQFDLRNTSREPRVTLDQDTVGNGRIRVLAEDAQSTSTISNNGIVATSATLTTLTANAINGNTGYLANLCGIGVVPTALGAKLQVAGKIAATDDVVTSGTFLGDGAVPLDGSNGEVLAWVSGVPTWSVSAASGLPTMPSTNGCVLISDTSGIAQWSSGLVLSSESAQFNTPPLASELLIKPYLYSGTGGFINLYELDSNTSLAATLDASSTGGTLTTYYNGTGDSSIGPSTAVFNATQKSAYAFSVKSATSDNLLNASSSTNAVGIRAAPSALSTAALQLNGNQLTTGSLTLTQGVSATTATVGTATVTGALGVNGAVPSSTYPIKFNYLDGDWYGFYPDGSDLYIKGSDGIFYFQTDEGTNTDTVLGAIGKGTGVGRVRAYSSGGTYYSGLTHDGSNAYFKTNQGSFYFYPDTLNANAIVSIKGNGAGYGNLYLFGPSGTYYSRLRNYSGNLQIYNSGTGSIDLQNNANTGNVTMFNGSTSGIAPTLDISGYNSSDSAKRTLSMGICSSTANCSRFSGTQSYGFTGTLSSTAGISTTTGTFSAPITLSNQDSTPATPSLACKIYAKNGSLYALDSSGGELNLMGLSMSAPTVDHVTVSSTPYTLTQSSGYNVVVRLYNSAGSAISISSIANGTHDGDKLTIYGTTVPGTYSTTVTYRSGYASSPFYSSGIQLVWDATSSVWRLVGDDHSGL